MAKVNKQAKPVQRQEVSGMERLGLRVSSMINHPLAQVQRWVTVHRLATDGEREWKGVMGLLSETDGVHTTLNDDASVTIRWDARDEQERPHEMMKPVEEPAHF